jgi:formamidopyrimidine-DNA glycosylase
MPNPFAASCVSQSFSAGVGNWVADEVLYQAALHPEQLVAKLGEQQLKELHEALLGVVRVAVEARADSDKFPQDWMFHHR